MQTAIAAAVVRRGTFRAAPLANSLPAKRSIIARSSACACGSAVRSCVSGWCNHSRRKAAHAAIADEQPEVFKGHILGAVAIEGRRSVKQHGSHAHRRATGEGESAARSLGHADDRHAGQSEMRAKSGHVGRVLLRRRGTAGEAVTAAVQTHQAERPAAALPPAGPTSQDRASSRATARPRGRRPRRGSADERLTASSTGRGPAWPDSSLRSLAALSRIRIAKTFSHFRLRAHLAVVKRARLRRRR